MFIFIGLFQKGKCTWCIGWNHIDLGAGSSDIIQCGWGSLIYFNWGIGLSWPIIYLEEVRLDLNLMGRQCWHISTWGNWKGVIYFNLVGIHSRTPHIYFLEQPLQYKDDLLRPGIIYHNINIVFCFSRVPTSLVTWNSCIFQVISR